MSFPIHVRGLDGVRLISPTEPDFDDLARPMIGRIAERALKLKPMLVIVANDSTQTVVAFSHKWTVTHQDGHITTSRSNSSFPHVVCGDVAVARGQLGLPPGSSRIETPNMVIHDAWRDPYYDQFFDQFVSERDQLISDAVDLQIELDAVIFADGTLIGPDDGGWLADLFSAYVEAKQDWYRGIIDALEAGRSIAEAHAAIDGFQADIQSRRKVGIRLGRDDPREVWRMQAAAEAQGWRRQFPEEEIRGLLKQAIRLKPFVIRRADHR
jgi:hypothetical protein